MLLDIKTDDPIVTLNGEVDASNADDLKRVLAAETERGGVLALDMADLEFLDASGADVLLDTAERLRGRGRLLLCRPSGSVRRVLDVLQANRIEGLFVVSAPPEEVLRERFIALARWDSDALNEMLAEDAVWHLPGRNPFAGSYKGKDAIAMMAARVKEFSSEWIHEVDDVLAGDDHVAILSHLWGDREGHILFGAREVTTFHLQGVQVAEAWSYLFDPSELDRFWG